MTLPAALRSRYATISILVTLPILYGILLLGPAFGMTTAEFFDQLVEKARTEGNTVSYGKLEENGPDAIIVQDFVIKDKRGERSLSIETLALTGGTSEDGVSYQFDTLNAKKIRLLVKTLDRDTAVDVKLLDAEQFRLSYENERKHVFWPFDLKAGDAQNIQILQKGEISSSFSIPQISVSELKALGKEAFSLGRFKMEASNGSFASADGADSSFALGEINMSGFELFENAGYGIASLEFGRIALEGSDGKSRSVNFSFDGFLAANLVSPDFTEDLNELFSSDKLDVKIGAANFSLDGQDLFAMAGGTATGSYSPDSKDYVSDFMLNDIFLNFKAIGEINKQEKELKPLLDLGYETVTFDLFSEVSFNLETGILHLTALRTDAKEMAAFDVSLKVGGYTIDVARKLQAISVKMNGATPELQQGLMFQMLAEFSALELMEAHIRIDDASLTKRLLDQQASKSGQTAEDMVAAIPFLAGAFLSQLDAPEFSANATTAVSTYLNSALKNSGSLVIQVKPKEPISFIELSGIISAVQAGNVKPSELIDRLDLTIVGE